MKRPNLFLQRSICRIIGVLINTIKEPTPENEMRVTSGGRIKSYISYAAKIFDNGKETIVIRGTGRAIPAAVQTAEVIKRRIKGLHQQTTVGSQEMLDEWEPIKEGLEKISQTRTVCHLTVILSKDENAVDKTAIGYQEPLDESNVKEISLQEMKREGPTRSRGGQRGGSGRGSRRGKNFRGNGRSFTRGRREFRGTEKNETSGQVC